MDMHMIKPFSKGYIDHCLWLQKDEDFSLTVQVEIKWLHKKWSDGAEYEKEASI